MTKKEALQILAILKAAYPNSYNGMTQKEASGTVAVWMMQFMDTPVDIVLMALQKCIGTNKFPPSISEVKSKIQSIHWEAYEMLTNIKPGKIPESVMQQYKRIYEETAEYKHGIKFGELPLSQMVTFGVGGQPLQIESAERIDEQ